YGLFPKREVSYKALMNDQSRLTIRQIFDLTPSPETVIAECRFRAEQFKMNMRHRKSCESVLNISKFYMQEFICYSVYLKNITSYDPWEILHSLQYSYVVFQYTFTAEMNRAAELRIMVYTDYLPFMSRDYAQILNPLED